MRLANKIVWIMGASRGIGAAMAFAASRSGAKVVISSRKVEGLTHVIDQLDEELSGSVVAVPCHVGRLEDIHAALAEIESRVGVPDVLVNNAATNPYFGPFIGADDAAWDKTFEVNLKGPFRTIQALVERWRDKGKGGSIINIASILGQSGAPFQGVYGMTKAALISMTKTLSLELGPLGIRVNAIAPGLVETRLASALIENEELAKIYTDRTALKRYAQPDEIAGAFLYLASDESSYMSGHTIVLDGGYSAG